MKTLIPLLAVSLAALSSSGSNTTLSESIRSNKLALATSSTNNLSKIATKPIILGSNGVRMIYEEGDQFLSALDDNIFFKTGAMFFSADITSLFTVDGDLAGLILDDNWLQSNSYLNNLYFVEPYYRASVFAFDFSFLPKGLLDGYTFKAEFALSRQVYGDPNALDGFYEFDYDSYIMYLDASVFLKYPQVCTYGELELRFIGNEPGALNDELNLLYEVLTVDSPSGYSREFLSVDVYRPHEATEWLDANNVAYPFPGDYSTTLYIDLDYPIEQTKILEQFNASDVFGMEVTLEPVSSTYPTDLSELRDGSNYKIVQRATDEYGNTAVLDITIIVIDYTPTITPVTGGSNHITFNYSQRPTRANLLSFFTAKSYSGAPLEIKLKKGQSFSNSKIGESTYTLVADDGKKHIVEYDIIVSIVQDIPPCIGFTEAVILCNRLNPLSIADIKNILTKQLGISGFKSLNLDSEYFTNSQEVGSYNLIYQGLDEQGNDLSGVIELNVIDYEEETIELSSINIWQRVSMFFESLGGWFKRVFTKFSFDWVWQHRGKIVTGI